MTDALAFVLAVGAVAIGLALVAFTRLPKPPRLWHITPPHVDKPFEQEPGAFSAEWLNVKHPESVIDVLREHSKSMIGKK